MKTLREYIDQLDEISRRDFLKGVGATAGLAAMGGAKGQETPASYGVETPSMIKDKILRKIKPNIVFNSNNFKGTQPTKLKVLVDSNFDKFGYGNVVKIDLVQSSGDANWDNAVIDAVKSAQTLPRLSNDNTETYNISLSAGKATNEEDLDEDSDDAVKRIEQLVKYK